MKFLKTCATALWVAGAAVTLAGQTSSGAPPVLQLDFQTLLPGRSASYSGLASALASGTAQANLAVYWISLRSVTGPDAMLSLGLYDSYHDLDQAAGTMAAGLAAHPDLAGKASQLLQEDVSGETRELLERRDDLSFEPGTLNFGRMRLLRLVTVDMQPGHDADFETLAHTLVQQAGRIAVTPSWVVYELHSGGQQPRFVILSVYPDLTTLDTPAERLNLFATHAGAAVLSVETQLYRVDPAASRVSAAFAASDPGFWTQP